jgi:alpha-beta hydrolase superfamily lysophospholipase
VAGWLDDASCALVSRPEYPGRVHCGFAFGLQSVWDQIEPLIAGAPARPLYVTGHSLGGALASLAQWRLAASGLNPCGGCTFGEPRVGDSTWATANTLPHWRVVHDCDPVPRVPFPPLYQHIGRMAWFDRFDRLNPDPTLWQRTVNWIEEDIDRFEGPWQLRVAQLAQEHTIDSYVAALAKAVA